MTLDKNNALDLAQYLSEWLYELECPISSHLLAKMINTYIEGDAAADAA
jgi:hypothetical protein